MQNLEIITGKIIDESSLQRTLAVWRFRGKKIVFTNGCFDLIHLGHVEYLSSAKDLGDILIIGLNTDASVQRLKGHGRPVNPEHARAMVLAALHFVDAVVTVDEDTPENLIRNVMPDVLVKGGDYKAEEVIGYNIVTAKGGKVEIIPLTAGFSTTSILRKIAR